MKKIILFIFLSIIIFVSINIISKYSEKTLDNKIQKNAEQIRLKIKSNGWSNDSLALDLAAIQVYYRHKHPKINISFNAEYYNNLQVCQGIIAQNLTPADSINMKIIYSKEMHTCIKDGNTEALLKLLKNV